MKKFALLAILLFACTWALADTVTIGGTVMAGEGQVSSVPGVVTINFNSGSAPAQYSGDFGIVQGSVPGQYAAPPADASYYISTPAPYNQTTSSYTLTLSGNHNYFGLYWGSIDSYNTIAFYNNNTPVFTYTGTQAAALAGNNNGAYFNFQLTNAYNKVVFSSTIYALETDNHAYNVPEPASLLLLGTGLSALGLRLRRKQ